MKPGQRLKSTQQAIDRGVFNRPQYGILIAAFGDFVSVLRLNLNTPGKYHKDFWEPFDGCWE